MEGSHCRSFDQLDRELANLRAVSNSQSSDKRSSNAGGRPIYNLIALGSLISALPLLIAFIVLGKYWRGGLTAGATKG